MWWESLPSLAIIGVALYSPYIFTYLTNRLFLGNPYKRELHMYDDAHHYLRDTRLGNKNAYNQIGLDSLEDDDVKVKE